MCTEGSPNRMYKLDLHTHSYASNDGSITAEQYNAALSGGLLDYIAITDHNRIDAALEIQKPLGDRIIVGEEISTTEGDLVGLFLTRVVKPGLSPADTIKAIKAQGGLVYVPHPFETVRKGMQQAVMNELANDIDIVEIHNGRAVFQNRSQKAIIWATMNHTARAASSDAHGAHGLAKTYTLVSEVPTAKNLLTLLAKSQVIVARPPLKTLLYPKLNRARKHVKRYIK